MGTGENPLKIYHVTAPISQNEPTNKRKKKSTQKRREREKIFTKDEEERNLLPYPKRKPKMKFILLMNFSFVSKTFFLSFFFVCALSYKNINLNLQSVYMKNGKGRVENPQTDYSLS